MKNVGRFLYDWNDDGVGGGLSPRTVQCSQSLESGKPDQPMRVLQIFSCINANPHFCAKICTMSEEPFGVPLPFFNLYLMEIKASKNS